MSEIVQATCPGCKNVLRIPAAWLGQAFKCKHCGLVIQARDKAPPPRPAAEPVSASKPVARPVAIPIAQAAPAKSSRSASGDPFSFGSDDDPAAPARSRPRARRRSGGGGLVMGLVLACALLVVAIIGTIVAWPYLSSHKPADQLARNDDTGKRDADPPSDLPRPRESGRKPDLPIHRDSGRRPDRSSHREPGPKPPPDLPKIAGPFPRRALAISINDYLFANPINYGMPGTSPRNVETLLSQRFSQPDGLHVPANQVAVLSDAASGRIARPPIDSVIRSTVINFLDTSRAQDRIILLIVGHVFEIGGEQVLLPIDGDPEAKEGGIPIKWIYERLAACKARQKLLILDTCRLDPSRGQERPGSGPMSAKLDALLKEPPPGVQVWSACVADQFSYEDINNGLFLDALYDVSSSISNGKIQKPGDPFPLARLVDAVNARLKQDLGAGKVQTSRLTGREPEGGAEPDPKKPPPPAPTVMAPPPLPGGTADMGLVRSILKDVSFPPLKVAKDQKPLTAESLPPFSADTLKEYMKDGEATPLRTEVQKARALLRDIAGEHKLNDSYRAIAEKPLKAAVFRDQKEVAKVIGDLQEASDALKAVADHRKDETKRWQATYDYVTARMEAQLAYLNEYQAVLGQIRKGLPPPSPGFNGWRLASQPDPQTGDSAAKKLTTDLRKKLAKIIQTYPDTPWAVMARRDRSSAGAGMEGNKVTSRLGKTARRDHRRPRCAPPISASRRGVDESHVTS